MASAATSNGLGQMPLRCLATRRDGAACQAPALPGTDRCVFHSPQSVAGRVKGGHKSATRERADKRLPSRLAPMVDLCEQAAQMAFAGTLTSEQAHLIAPLVRAMIAAYLPGELEERLQAVEANARRERFMPPLREDEAPARAEAGTEGHDVGE